MFRPLSGFKAKYGDLTLITVSEFDEWRVVVHSPDVVLQGVRQFTAPKAKDHALMLAKAYLSEVKHTPSDQSPEPEWLPTGSEDWLLWKV